LFKYDYYKILELSDDAGIMEIKKAYRNLAKRFHPDVNHSPDAQEKFILINEAYEYLIQAKLDTPIFKAKTSNKSNFSEEDWIFQERQRARKRAAQNAQKKYAEFMQSKIYKSAVIIYTLVDLIFMLVFFMMIFIPIIYTINNGLDPKRMAMNITAVVLVSMLGAIMLYVSLKDNHFFRIFKFKKFRKN